MSHPRRFLCPTDLDHPPWKLEGGEACHLLRSLRLGAGDAVTLMDGRGGLRMARLAQAGKTHAVAEPEGQLVRIPAPALRPWLLVGAPDPPVLDGVVEASTELGVWRVAVTLTEHSPAPFSVLEKRLVRWRTLVSSAGKQSGNPWFPELLLFRSVDEALAKMPKRGLLLAQGGAPLGSGPAREAERATGDVCLAVGPEGDFTSGEREALTGAGLRPVSLGPHVLRTGTACLAALAALAAGVPDPLGSGEPLR